MKSNPKYRSVRTGSLGKSLSLAALLLTLASVFSATPALGVVVTVGIEQATDDALVTATATGEISTTIYWPYSNDTKLTFLRWKSMIPRGATITEAYIKVRPNGTSADGNPSAIRLQVLDSGDIPTFETSPIPFSSAVMTNFVDSTVPGVWTTNLWVSSDNINSIIQAYIDRPDYDYGNYIGIRGSHASGGLKRAYTWDFDDHSSAPQLEVHYTGGETVLDLWMADPEVRLAQKVYCQIDNRSDTDTLRVKLDGNVIYTKVAPLSTSEEIFTADYRALGIGSHTLLVEILDDVGGIRATANRTWTKLHDGIAAVAIDENNAICRHGIPFFPITPWGTSLGTNTQATWEGQINTMNGLQFGSEKTVEAWSGFLEEVEATSYPIFGPARGDYYIGGYDAHISEVPPGSGNWVSLTSLDIDKVAEYIIASKFSKSLLAYVWVDEPDLGGVDDLIPATEVHRWTQKSHELDTEHPHYLNIVGYNFTGAPPHPNFGNLKAQGYCFLYNDRKTKGLGTNAPFAEKTLVADILSFDYYPYEREFWTSSAGWLGLPDLAQALDNFNDWNYNLAPIMTWIETCDVDDSKVGQESPNAPTPAELHNLIWLSIIHEVKGIQWFHYFLPTPAENRVVMESDTELITMLTQPILSAPENVTWTVTDQELGGERVDMMTREYDNRLYIFSTHMEREGAGQTVRFDMPGIPAGATIGVVGESRTITASADYFEDTFSPLAVHIYTYPALTNMPPIAKAGINQTVSDTDVSGFETVTLTEESSFDTDGTIASYVWMDGASQIATGATTPVSLATGEHLIALVVTDNDGASASNLVSITVNPPPVAHAGADQQVNDIDNDGSELITLDGSASSDAMGTIVSYVWTQGGQPLATGVTAQVSLFAGTHDITLTVTDDDGSTDSDTVQMIVVNPNVINVQYQIAASEDDTWVKSDNTQFVTRSEMYFPYSTTDRRSFIRWSLNIPTGANILSATLQLKSNGDHYLDIEDPSTARLQLLDYDNAPSLASIDFNLPVTAATEDWILPGEWATNAWYQSGNIQALVQEFIDRAGYAEGNYLGLRGTLFSGKWKEVYQWDNGAHTDGAILSVTYLPNTDIDGDGLPDSWETQYFGGATNANPATMASNGVNTLLETYIAGLNPTNALSVLTISGQPTLSQTLLQWSAVSGRVYNVYWATNLLTGFQPLKTNILWPQNSWTDLLHAAESEGFYRIEVEIE